MRHGRSTRTEFLGGRTVPGRTNEEPGNFVRSEFLPLIQRARSSGRDPWVSRAMKPRPIDRRVHLSGWPSDLVAGLVVIPADTMTSFSGGSGGLGLAHKMIFFLGGGLRRTWNVSFF
jgi:hypothetical protein